MTSRSTHGEAFEKIAKYEPLYLSVLMTTDDKELACRLWQNVNVQTEGMAPYHIHLACDLCLVHRA